ncbi:hypothetical protein QAD02_021822 [Eretmocerus hayati]|uniref:Uncharacterized protein n=1 Tax=Eretmocerus hayati TaxID=131215 RepID=A0ACC2PTS8_9HYME|nr:hypothetical protein QAD02_021822 [Eretmocerus hayati]
MIIDEARIASQENTNHVAGASDEVPMEMDVVAANDVSLSGVGDNESNDCTSASDEENDDIDNADPNLQNGWVAERNIIMNDNEIRYAHLIGDDAANNPDIVIEETPAHPKISPFSSPIANYNCELLLLLHNHECPLAVRLVQVFIHGKKILAK